MQSGSKPEPQSPNSEEVDGKPDFGKRKRLNEEIKRENEVLFFNVSRGEGERKSQGKSRSVICEEESDYLFFFLVLFFNVKLPKRRRFGSLYVYDNITQEKGKNIYIIFLLN